MLHRWGYGEFSAHFLVGAECLLLYTNQRFRQFDRGYLLMLVGGAQSSGESGVRANRCGCGGMVGGELSRGDGSYAVGNSEGVSGTIGIGGKIEALITRGFIGSEGDHFGGVGGVFGKGDAFKGCGFVTGLFRLKGE